MRQIYILNAVPYVIQDATSFGDSRKGQCILRIFLRASTFMLQQNRDFPDSYLLKKDRANGSSGLIFFSVSDFLDHANHVSSEELPETKCAILVATPDDGFEILRQEFPVLAEEISDMFLGVDIISSTPRMTLSLHENQYSDWRYNNCNRRVFTQREGLRYLRNEEPEPVDVLSIQYRSRADEMFYVSQSRAFPLPEGW